MFFDYGIARLLAPGDERGRYQLGRSWRLGTVKWSGLQPRQAFDVYGQVLR